MLPAPLKITFLTVMPSPYVQDLFAALAADDRIRLTVWYLEQVAPDTYWGEQQMPDYAQVLPGKWYGFSGARVHWNPGIADLIRNSDADLFVIVGYIGLTNQVAMRTLNRLGRPWVFWGEVPGLHKRGPVGKWLRSLLQKPLCHVAGVAGVGSHAVAAYTKLLQILGATTRTVHNIPYHCDILPFQLAAQDRSPSKTIRFLYCGQLIHRKGVDLLCDAFAQLVHDGASVHLTVAGEGPLRESLLASFSEQVVKCVTLQGFVEVEDLPVVFGQNDVFVLPSRHDGWGVVVNQAIAAGMPVIVSTAVGAGNDLVVDRENGLIIEANSVSAIYRAMKTLADGTELSRRMSESSSARASSISLIAAVNQWHHFFCECLNAPVGVAGAKQQ